MASSKSFTSTSLVIVLVALSFFPGLERASAAGNRRLLTPMFPGIPDLPLPTLLPPILPSPNTDPSTPSFPNFPTFPGTTPLPTFPFTPNLPTPTDETSP